MSPSEARCPIDHAALTGLSGPTGCPVSAGAAAFDPFADGYQQDPPEYVRNYAARNALPFKVALDSDGTAAKGFEEVRLTPTTFLLDKQGRIVQKYLGAPDFPKLHALLEKLLAEPA